MSHAQSHRMYVDNSVNYQKQNENNDKRNKEINKQREKPQNEIKKHEETLSEEENQNDQWYGLNVTGFRSAKHLQKKDKERLKYMRRLSSDIDHFWPDRRDWRISYKAQAWKFTKQCNDALLALIRWNGAKCNYFEFHSPMEHIEATERTLINWLKFGRTLLEELKKDIELNDFSDII